MVTLIYRGLLIFQYAEPMRPKTIEATIAQFITAIAEFIDERVEWASWMFRYIFMSILVIAIFLSVVASFLGTIGLFFFVHIWAFAWAYHFNFAAGVIAAWLLIAIDFRIIDNWGRESHTSPKKISR